MVLSEGSWNGPSCQSLQKSRPQVIQKKSASRLFRNLLTLNSLLGSGGRIRTCDLWVMSPTSYQTAPPRVVVMAEA